MTTWLPYRLYRSAFLAGLALIGPIHAEAAPNLAQGAAYVYSPPALYDLTRDEGDAVQLTDGAQAPDTMWTSRKAVGWMAGAAPIEIEIDLGGVKTVGSVCVRLARRTEAGVSFPRRVDIFASADRERYAWVGYIMTGQEVNEGPYLAKRFCSGTFQRDDRYIRVLVAAKGMYFFTDEIEVWPPAGALLSSGSQVKQPAPLALSEIKRFALEHEAVSRMVESLVKRHVVGTTTSKLAEQLRQITRGLGDDSGALELERLVELEQEMRQAVREERAKAQHVLDVRLTDPWRLATPIDAAPPLHTDGETHLPQGGHATIALAVEHAEEQPLRVSVTTEVLGANKDALQLSLFEVATITRADGVRQGDPLLPLRNGNLEVATGESKQLWIDVAAAPSGSTGPHTLRVRLETMIRGRPVSRLLDIPARVWVVPPPPVPPSTVVWGYLDSPPIRGLAKAAAADMLAHGVTTAVLPAGDLPWPKPGASLEGALIGDYRKFDEVMEALKGHRQYLFFLSFNSDSSNRTFGRKYPFLSDSWKALFTAWIKEWSSRLKQSGIGYDAFAFYPVDEPHKGVELDALTAVAHLIKAADPRIRVYTTLHQPEVLSNALIDEVDIFQLNGQALTAPLISKLKARGKQVWAYATLGGGKAGDPASFYRAQAWEAFALGLSGFGFWAYADVGRSGTAWNDTDDARPDFAVIYEGKRSIVSSKRWEAWREGVQDFSLLFAALANARTETEREAVRTLAIEGQRAIGDSAKFEKIRRKLLEPNGARGAADLPK